MAPLISLYLLLTLLGTCCSRFVFEAKLLTITDLEDCYDALETIDTECETYLAKFCLREARDPSVRSDDVDDCPLGRSGRFGHDGALPIIKPIYSSQPWPGKFQLYIKARDEDLHNPDDDRDFIYIDMSLEVSQWYTSVMDFTGDRSKVRLSMSFRLQCEKDYYGDNCTVFCVAQDDNVTGHYLCNSDGSIQCLPGFENPKNHCTVVINPCVIIPCANNGSCISMGPFNYTCQCPPGYSGSNCEAEENNVEAEENNILHLNVSDNTKSTPDDAYCTTVTITIAITGTLLGVCVIASVTIATLLLGLKQKICSHPLSTWGSTVKQTKQGLEAYIDSSMQPNLLYDSNNAPQPSRPCNTHHNYEIVTSADTVVNMESNVVCGTQNPLFCNSDTVLESGEQPADQDPGYSYSNVKSGRVAVLDDSKHLFRPPLPPRDGKGTANLKLRVNLEPKNEHPPYNRLQHGTNIPRPQPRLSKMDGLGYDALVAAEHDDAQV